MRQRLLIAGAAGGLAIVAFALSRMVIPAPVATPASTDTGYADAALGIRFAAPSGLYYVAAQPVSNASEYLSTTARLSTYSTRAAQAPVDFRNELLVEFTLVRSITTDLRDIATRRLSYSGELRPSRSRSPAAPRSRRRARSRTGPARSCWSPLTSSACSSFRRSRTSPRGTTRYSAACSAA